MIAPKPRDVLSLIVGPEESKNWSALMVIQRNKRRDGWLCVDREGVIFDIGDPQLARYRIIKHSSLVPFLAGVRNPTEWFGCEPVKLRV